MLSTRGWLASSRWRISQWPDLSSRCVGTSGIFRSASTNLPPRIKVNEEDITENFIKGGGAGGQKINKTNSQVQLIHHPTGIQVRCQETRSRSQNRTIARRILAERIEELEKGDQSRTALKAQRAVKKKANAIKKKRRKYKRLSGDGNTEGGVAAEEQSVDDQSDSNTQTPDK